MFEFLLSFFSDDNSSDFGTDLDSEIHHTDSFDETHHNHTNEVHFGAGNCSRCGGYGYTSWKGDEAPCWYCNGSGVAH